MISSFEQTLLFATTIVILSGTLVVFVWQWWRHRGRDED